MKTTELNEKNVNLLAENSAECVVVLKKDGNFPLTGPCRVALFGNGARRTLKGGTGSGTAETFRDFSCEGALRDRGFEITTSSWLDGYDRERSRFHQDFIAAIKKTAAEQGVSPFIAGFGKIEIEHDYDLPLDAEGDVCLYVLSRTSGEGNDRGAREGDVFLTKTEIRDIDALSRTFPKFMLVLNVCGVVDLSPVLHVPNILVLSQLGAVTGDILADILLGRKFPSGKLATTWAKYPDYPTIGDFGDRDDTRYKEGVYVGYRYFDTAGIPPLFPFGYGLSFTDFHIVPQQATRRKSRITVKVEVENIGEHAGKEILEVYVTPPVGTIDKPHQSLVAFQKTDELRPREKQTLRISFDLDEAATYFPAQAQYRLEKGTYLIRIGNSSRNTRVAAVVELQDDVVTRQVRNSLGRPDFADAVLPRIDEPLPTGVRRFHLSSADFSKTVVSYQIDRHVHPFVQNLSDGELAHFCLGAHLPDSKLSILGNAALHVSGAAGETSNFLLEKLNGKYLVMADGPAGLRISADFVQTPAGPRPVMEKLPDALAEIMPDEVNARIKAFFDSVPKASVRHQYVTALPTATAIAQSWNPAFAELCGDIVGSEMESYRIHLWLAPAMNIHRNILCGRNFEYFSEDPLISGKMASAITKGVQEHPGRGTTLKHFCANNQEFNRMNNNSLVSERAMREIYLKGFEICVKESQPAAVMTSYNLLNGEHTSQRKDLIDDILRGEWGFQGLVMSDWIQTGFSMIPTSKHPPVRAHKLVKAGNDIMMPGVNADFEDIMTALGKGEITREDLLVCATRVYETIQKND